MGPGLGPERGERVWHNALPLIWMVLVAGIGTMPPLISWGDNENWRVAFWIFGILGLIWCVLFTLWFRNHPGEHHLIGHISGFGGSREAIRGAGASTADEGRTR